MPKTVSFRIFLCKGSVLLSNELDEDVKLSLGEETSDEDVKLSLGEETSIMFLDKHSFPFVIKMGCWYKRRGN